MLCVINKLMQLETFKLNKTKDKINNYDGLSMMR